MLHPVLPALVRARRATRARHAFRHPRPVLLAMALLVAWVPGCSDEDPTTPLQPCPAGEALSITVTSEDVPSIAWEPECLVGRLFVTPPPSTGGFLHVWQVEGMAEGFGPLVLYGEVPEGAAPVFGPLPLQEGIGYRVTLWRMDGSIAGSTTFVR